jgi:hypothetical protein
VTAREFISTLALAPVDTERLSTIFRFLAVHAYEFRLEGGKQLRDASDFKQLLHEISEAAANARDCRKVMGTFVIADPCPRCGHVHQGSPECGEEIGGGRTCHCELEVRA